MSEILTLHGIVSRVWVIDLQPPCCWRLNGCQTQPRRTSPALINNVHGEWSVLNLPSLPLKTASQNSGLFFYLAKTLPLLPEHTLLTTSRRFTKQRTVLLPRKDAPTVVRTLSVDNLSALKDTLTLFVIKKQTNREMHASSDTNNTRAYTNAMQFNRIHLVQCNTIQFYSLCEIFVGSQIQRQE